MNGKYILVGHDVVEEPDLIVWAKWLEKTDRTVRQTRVGEQRVSTVFLGLDHSFVDGTKPLVFETMVFEGDSYEDKFCKRYCTWDEAVVGHDDCVSRLKAHESLEALADE